MIQVILNSSEHFIKRRHSLKICSDMQEKAAIRRFAQIRKRLHHTKTPYSVPWFKFSWNVRRYLKPLPRISLKNEVLLGKPACVNQTHIIGWIRCKASSHTIHQRPVITP